MGGLMTLKVILRLFLHVGLIALGTYSHHLFWMTTFNESINDRLGNDLKIKDPENATLRCVPASHKLQ
jgi:hypothetical protein